MLDKEELQKFGFELVRCNHIKQDYKKQIGLVDAYVINYETSGEIDVFLTDSCTTKHYKFDYPNGINHVELTKMFEFVSDYLIPYFVNETEEYHIKLINGGDILLKNVEFPHAGKEWELVTHEENSEDGYFSGEDSFYHYRKDFGNAVININIYTYIRNIFIYGLNKVNFEFLAKPVGIDGELNKERIDQILKVIDDVIVPYYYDGVKDYEKMVSAFNSLGLVCKTNGIF